MELIKIDEKDGIVLWRGYSDESNLYVGTYVEILGKYYETKCNFLDIAYLDTVEKILSGNWKKQLVIEPSGFAYYIFYEILPDELKKIASALSNPVLRKLDYVGISRKFVVSEELPEGVPIVFDKA